MQNINEHASTAVHKILVGNKVDMTKERCVSTEEGVEIARNYGMVLFETSAQSGTAVEDAFLCLATEIYKAHPSGKEDVQVVKKLDLANRQGNCKGKGSNTGRCTIL